jgi:hypothetical protein
MTRTTELELKSLAGDISVELSNKRNDIVDVYIGRQEGKRSFHLGKFGAHEIVKGKNADELYARGQAFLEGLRFQ